MHAKILAAAFEKKGLRDIVKKVAAFVFLPLQELASAIRSFPRQLIYDGYKGGRCQENDMATQAPKVKNQRQLNKNQRFLSSYHIANSTLWKAIQIHYSYVFLSLEVTYTVRLANYLHRTACNFE